MRRSVASAMSARIMPSASPAAIASGTTNIGFGNAGSTGGDGLVQNGDVGEGQLALQPRLRGHPLARVEFVEFEGDVSLQIAQAISLGLSRDQGLLGLRLGDLERGNLALRRGDPVFQVVSRLVDGVRQLFAHRCEVRRG